ncbi:MAG: beta-ketoacyl synthase N-terminal-like domain-containing protein, partial [Myxococcota bacterium]
MGGSIHVLLPPTAFHLADLVLESGCIPVLDATVVTPDAVPDGAWVRIRPGHPAPGSGPVVLAEDGAAVLDRPTWLEASSPRELPAGFAGFILKGREAAGVFGEADGFEQLTRALDPAQVILDAGVGPDTAAAAAALGAAGVWIAGPILGFPEVGLPTPMLAHLARPDDEVTTVVQDVRVANSPTSPVLRRLLAGEDAWALQANLWSTGDLRSCLWPLDQGAALSIGLVERHGTLGAVLAAYQAGWNAWPANAGRATAAPTGRTVHSGAALAAAGTVAGHGQSVGSAVLWQEAAWLDRPVTGPVVPAVATGRAVAAPAAEVQSAAAALLDRAVELGVPTTTDVPKTPAPPAAPPPTPVPTSESSVSEPAPTGKPAIAIVGMGCRMPGAQDLETFWANIKNGVSAIGPVPVERWDPELYFDADPNTPDMTYTKIGGFIRDFVFDAKRFRIPPRVAIRVDPVQQLALHAVHDALADAKLQLNNRDNEGRPFDRERCAVILGNSLGGELKDDYAIRLGWPAVRKKMAESQALASLPADQREALLTELEASYKDGMPEIDEDSMPGELSNVISGRVANAFDLRGANFTTDAACASSLAAVQVAVKSLQDRDIDMAITGGADRSMNIATYVKFCKIGALSPDHSSPFDASANGFVMGEGAGVLILKRLEDAVADNDKIYALIRGIGASSDGKGKGITAPNPIGQRLALERAYHQAGVAPETVDLIEAHGTSTVVGDAVELSTFSEFVGSGKREDRGPIRVGSVKSMIGHLKSAAGAAALIKAAAALHEHTLPPSLGFQNARDGVDLDKVPVKVQTHAEPWPTPAGGLRRAGVSAFGFGGTNFHIVLEEYAGQALVKSPAFTPTQDQVMPAAPATAAAAPLAMPAKIETVQRPLPEGVWATSATDRPGLLRNLNALLEGRSAPWNPSDPLRIAAASDSPEDRKKKLERAIKVVTKEQNPDLLRARNIYFEDAPVDGKVAFFFTGQGSQYLNMGLDLAEAYPIVKQTFEEADRIVGPTLGRGITDFIALRDGEDAEAKEQTLRQTEYSQPATLTLDVAILRLLASYGVYPDMVAGHSLGEYGACVAAGIMDFEQALMAVSARGREMASIKLDDPGKMAGLATNIDVVEEVLAEVQGYVIAANKNCPSQTVIAGASDAVDEAIERFQARGVTVYRLPVSHAFHSSIVAPASEPLRGVLTRLGLKAPRRPITTNVTSEYYPTDDTAVDAVIDTLAKQISAPVEWIAQLERMYEDGARVFVECGPKRALTGFAVSILKRRPHRAYYTNHPKRGGVWAFRDALAGMLAAGMPVRHEPAPGMPDLFATPEPRKATTEAVTAHLALVEQATEATPDVREGILRIVANKSGYDVRELDLDFELEADLGIDTVKQAEIFAVVRETYGIAREDDFRFDHHRSLRSVIQWAATQTGATRPTVPVQPTAASGGSAPTSADASAGAMQSFLHSAASAGLGNADANAFVEAVLPSMRNMLDVAFKAAQQAAPSTPSAPAVPAATGPVASVPHAAAGPGAWPKIVCTGASLGLPGGSGVFHDENLTRILHGENRISHIRERTQHFMDLGLVRLVKDPATGQGHFLPVEDEDQVIRLAGLASHFDLREYGVPENLIRAYDITTQLAIAAA